jgi:hypothetical protein
MCHLLPACGHAWPPACAVSEHVRGTCLERRAEEEATRTGDLSVLVSVSAIVIRGRTLCSIGTVATRHPDLAAQCSTCRLSPLDTTHMQLGRRTGMCGEKMMQAGAVRCRGLSDGERQPTHRLPFPEGWMTTICLSAAPGWVYSTRARVQL